MSDEPKKTESDTARWNRANPQKVREQKERYRRSVGMVERANCKCVMCGSERERMEARTLGWTFGKGAAWRGMCNECQPNIDQGGQ